MRVLRLAIHIPEIKVRENIIKRFTFTLAITTTLWNIIRKLHLITKLLTNITRWERLAAKDLHFQMIWRSFCEKIKGRTQKYGRCSHSSLLLELQKNRILTTPAGLCKVKGQIPENPHWTGLIIRRRRSGAPSLEGIRVFPSRKRRPFQFQSKLRNLVSCVALSSKKNRRTSADVWFGIKF